tara:strand:+ start:238 stop:540 length:303 start_codon:yes stop_codon:yes gene_type:complete
MAIQKRTTPIPTPSEIKSTPQSFSQEELDSINSIRSTLSKLTFDLGALTINKIKLENLEKDIKKQLSDLEKKESDIGKKLSNKYGDGSIDLETGTFTPLN